MVDRLDDLIDDDDQLTDVGTATHKRIQSDMSNSVIEPLKTPDSN
jgi:hypothetical protein